MDLHEQRSCERSTPQNRKRRCILYLFGHRIPMRTHEGMAKLGVLNASGWGALEKPQISITPVLRAELVSRLAAEDRLLDPFNAPTATAIVSAVAGFQSCDRREFIKLDEHQRWGLSYHITPEAAGLYLCADQARGQISVRMTVDGALVTLPGMRQVLQSRFVT